MFMRFSLLTIEWVDLKLQVNWGYGNVRFPPGHQKQHDKNKNELSPPALRGHDLNQRIVPFQWHQMQNHGNTDHGYNPFVMNKKFACVSKIHVVQDLIQDHSALMKRVRSKKDPTEHHKVKCKENADPLWEFECRYF